MNLVLGPIALPAVRQAIWLLVLLQGVAMMLLTLLMIHLPGLSPGVEKSLFGAWVMLVGVPIAFTPLLHPHGRPLTCSPSAWGCRCCRCWPPGWRR